MRRAPNVLRVLASIAVVALFWLAIVEIMLDRQRTLAEARLSVAHIADEGREQVRALIASATAETKAVSLRLQTAMNANSVSNMPRPGMPRIHDARATFLLDDSGKLVAQLPEGAHVALSLLQRAASSETALFDQDQNGFLVHAPWKTTASGGTLLALVDAPSLMHRVRVDSLTDGALALRAAPGSGGNADVKNGSWIDKDGVESIVADRVLTGTDAVVVASLPRSAVLVQWWYRSSLFVLIALLLSVLIELTTKYARRLTQRHTQRLQCLASISAELIGFTKRAPLLARVSEHAVTLIGNCTARIVVAGDVPGGPHATQWPICGGGPEWARLEITRAGNRPLDASDEAALRELTHRAAAALDNIRLLEARDRAAEDATRHSHDAEQARRKVEMIFAAMSDAVFALDRKARIVFVNKNAESLFGRQREQLIGRSLRSVLPPEHAPALHAAFTRAMRGGADISFQSGWRFRENETGRWVAARAFPHEDGLTVYLQDITRQVESEERLRQAAKMDAIGQLTGGIAHDFNNLLTVILGNLEMIELLDLPPDQEVLVGEAMHAAGNARDLTRQLLAFARRQPLAPREIDVAILAEDLLALLRRTLGPKVAIELSCQPDLRSVLADPTQLETAIINLALNARDAMPAGGTLSIGLENLRVDEATESRFDVPAGEYVRILVADTGHGIPATDLSKVFEPFFTTKAAGQGTGLGLSMVYGFAKQSGGTAQIVSEPGRGTTVALVLPRGQTQALRRAEPPPRVGRSTDPLPRGAETVLFVEDSPPVQNFTVGLLRDLGYRVVAVGDAEAALRTVQTGLAPDILLTDVVLPGKLDGKALAERLRERLPLLPVLFVSAFTDLGTSETARLSPGDDLLPKPFSRAELAQRLRMKLQAKVEHSQ